MFVCKFMGVRYTQRKSEREEDRKSERSEGKEGG